MGVLDPFTAGQCHALALALHGRTQWPMVGDFDVQRTTLPLHVLVRLPDGSLLDANRVIYGRVRLHGDDQRPLTPADVWKLVARGEYAPPDLELATRYVDSILALPMVRRAARRRR
jgi:hypothetical protein